MPKALRYGLIIAVIAIILYLVARNFDDVLYSFGHAVFEVKGQEEKTENVFGMPEEQGEPGNEAMK